jgi:hypothetical protein
MLQPRVALRGWILYGGTSLLSTGSLLDREYLLSPLPPYYSQFASRAEVSRYLSDPNTVFDDPRLEDFGFESPEEYAFWAPRLCGIICTKMIIDADPESRIETVATLTRRGLELGGYRLRDEDGNCVDKGWFYKPLIALAGEYGLAGTVFAGAQPRDLCSEVLLGRAAIASVHPGVIRGDIDVRPNGASGGHLVVVIGFRWSRGSCSGLIIHNPSGRTIETQEQSLVPIDRFDQAFAGRGFLLWRNCGAD